MGSPLLRNPDKNQSVTSLPAGFWDDRFWQKSTPNLTLNRTVARRGTGIPCEIPVTLVNLDSLNPFSESCKILVVNLNGCAARSTPSVEIGSAAELHGLTARTVTAKVVTCFSLGEHEKIWLLGLELQSPGNVWGIEDVPEDWTR